MSLLLTNCSLVVQTSSTIWQFLGLNGHNTLKNRCLSCSTNSVCFHFRERVEKPKDHGKNTKIENLQNGQEKYGGGKTRIHEKMKWSGWPRAHSSQTSSFQESSKLLSKEESELCLTFVQDQSMQKIFHF